MVKPILGSKIKIRVLSASSRSFCESYTNTKNLDAGFQWSSALLQPNMEDIFPRWNTPRTIRIFLSTISNTLFLFLSTFILFLVCKLVNTLLTFSLITDCYDPLDPNGNIAVTYDIVRWTDDGYQARITIQNYYQYRHIEKPGWQLGWTWAGNEVIWSMSGAFATKQGNCSTFKSEIPHCCKKDPIIVDLAPEAPPEKRSDGCCHGGFLAASAINPSNSFVSFEMKVGNLRGNYTAHKPLNLTLMAPGLGYTCDDFVDTDPTISSVIEGKRQEQVIRTWKSTCTYSTFLANRSPTCCVSLSTFYNPEVTPCRLCSCGCKLADNEAKSCIRQSSSSERELVQCTDHMCPLRVHWHIKKNYRNYWRVKLTISNYNLGKNYSNWNVVVQHPGFSQQSTVFSFNNTVLPTVGVPDEVALFWGLDFYNDALLQAEEKQVGSVMTEILLLKDMNSFTLSNGWAFPRRVYFNGENCEMPLPDTFPMLPNGCSKKNPYRSHLSLLVLLYLTYKTL
ncbi:COBRA-like protein 1 [Nicotiana tomentosiformis]|uniref:COBRA-like protein 1 n=1 Tax=Nicotiana tomentosiformis TaxID=4098 RepID=UPI00388C86A7